jgi:O-antigen/teichoic acid export membrane protein
LSWIADIRSRPRIVRDVFWVGFGALSSALARIVGLRVLTELLSPDTFGRMNLFLGFTFLGSGVFVVPFLQGILRFYPEAARDGRVRALRRVATSLLARSGAVGMALVIAAAWIWSLREGPPVGVGISLLLALVFVADAVRLLETNLLSAARRQLGWGMWTAADAWVKPLASAIAIVALGPTVEIALLGQCVGMFLVNLLFTPFRERGTADGGDATAWSRDVRRDLLRFAAPLALMAVPNFLYNLGDRYILAWLSDEAAVGRYAAAYGLATMPFMYVAGIATTTFRPVLFDAIVHEDGAKVRKTLGTWILGLVLICLAGLALLVWLAPFLVRVVLNERFWGAVEIVPWLAAAAVVQAVQQAFETLIHAGKRTHRLIAIQTASALLAVGFYLALIPSMGARGAAIATLCAAACSCLLTLAGADLRGILGTTRPAGNPR